MKRLLSFFFVVTALIGTVNAQNKTTMLEVHDFIGFNNGNTPTIDGNGGIVSLNGRIYGSWIDGNPRFTISSGTWQTWHQGNDDNNPTYLWAPDGSTFTINDLFVGDVVTVETLGNCSVNGNSLSEGSHELPAIESNGPLTINCVDNHAGIRKVSIATQHMATYVIENQTYKFTSGGVLPDKRKAVPYITMSFGNEDMDYAYVKYYGEENGQKQFGSFMLTETMDDTNFIDLEGRDFYRNLYDQYERENWNNANGPYVLKEPVVFKGANFSEYVPWHGTYYYFYPETNGKLYVHMHSDPVTKELADGDYKHDVMFLWDKTSNDGADASSFNYHLEGFYKFGTDAQNGVRVKKNHAYFMCTTPNDPRRRNVAHLLDYTFVPDFKMEPLYAVIDPGYEPQTSGQIAVSNLDFTDSNPNLHYRVKKCLGNIASATVKIENNKLWFTNITYKSGNVNKGGAVIVDVDCTDGQADFVLTVPYSAEPIDGTGKEVKKWDFYSNIIDNEVVGYNYDNSYEPFSQAKEPLHGKKHLGQYSDENSGLHYETEKDPGEWLNTYINLEGEGTEPIFKNVYDIEGDNADMIWDTNGLVFFAESNNTGIYNENNAPSSSFQDRYIGLMKGSEFTIPRLTAGDRIVIKMGTYGNLTDAPETTTLQITNAKDAIGTTISGDYEIGGSAPIEDDDPDANGNYVPRGEYHFIVAGNDNGDVTFKVADGQPLKLYTIQIYKNDEIVTENEILGDPDDDNKRYILNTKGASTNDDVLLHAHYNGLNEPFSYHNEEAKTGNLENTNFNVGTSHENDLWYTYSIVPQPKDAATEKYGAFMAKIGVKTIGDDESAYVTDYAYCMVPVGYREKMEYPYTWDFTDLKKYVGAGIDTDGTEKKVDEEDNDLIEDDLKIWNEYDFRTNSEKYDGYIFASGGQLYGGTKMFDETRGIGIIHNGTNKAMTMNGSADAEDGNLAVTEEFGFVIPKVAKGQAVYVHTTGSGTIAQYTIGNGTKTDLTKIGSNVFAMSNNSSTSDVTLYFKGYEVNKIAVSPYKKTVNEKGWASESRDEAIDHSLTGYFAGQDMHVYVVSGVNYDNRTLTLTDIAASTSPTPILAPVQPANSDANSDPVAQGCLIYTGSESTLELVDGGFHFFVPDMHDKDVAAKKFTDTNMLKAQLTQTKIYQFDGEDDELTNYVLSYKYYDLAPDGTPGTTQHEGPEMFYRVSNKGINLRANSAYLQLPTSSVKNPTNHAKFMLIFDDEENNVATSIDDIFGGFENENNVWYNLNGQKLNGKPQKRGLYIVNGKKVSVK